MKKYEKFIVIDDDPSNNLLCHMTIQLAFGKKVHVRTFTSAVMGLQHIKEEYQNQEAILPTVLFLDINMPEINGWDTLERIEELDTDIKKQLIVYMLSSSIDEKDKKRAMGHPLVRNFIEKPLTVKKLKLFFGNNSDAKNLPSTK